MRKPLHPVPVGLDGWPVDQRRIRDERDDNGTGAGGREADDGPADTARPHYFS